MNAAEILTAVREAGAALRVEGGSLVASNASRLPPEIKTAIRENKPQIITALSVSAEVRIFTLPPAGRYRKVFLHLQRKPPALIPVERWQRCVEDAKTFLRQWGEQAESLGWSSADLFGLHTPPANPHPSYSRLSRYDATGLVWLLQGRPVIALTADTAAIQSAKTGSVTVYRKANKPGYGPVGDSLEDFNG